MGKFSCGNIFAIVFGMILLTMIILFLISFLMPSSSTCDTIEEIESSKTLDGGFGDDELAFDF